MAVITFEHTRSDLEKERMSFAFFLAAALHILLLFGIGFSVVTFKSSVHSIDVTLAHEPVKDQPENANFIAQSNQLGSGESPDKEELTTNVQAPRNQKNITPPATATRDGTR